MIRRDDMLGRLEYIDADALDDGQRKIFRRLFDRLFRLVVMAGLGAVPASQEDVEEFEVLQDYTFEV